MGVAAQMSSYTFMTYKNQTHKNIGNQIVLAI